MRIFALCTKRSERAVRSALGVDPVTSPPYIFDEIGLQDAQDADFWYIRLHGVSLVPDIWYGEEEPGMLIPALGIDQIKGLDLRATLVLSAACFGLESDFPEAFTKQGASFIGGSGLNFGALSGRVIGADRLAMWVARGLSSGLSHKGAYKLAKARSLLSFWRVADRDTYQFKFVG